MSTHEPDQVSEPLEPEPGEPGTDAGRRRRWDAAAGARHASRGAGCQRAGT